MFKNNLGVQPGQVVWSGKEKLNGGVFEAETRTQWELGSIMKLRDNSVILRT